MPQVEIARSLVYFLLATLIAPCHFRIGLNDAFENAGDEEIELILNGKSTLFDMPHYDELIDVIYGDPTNQGEELSDDAIKVVFFRIGHPKRLRKSGKDRMYKLLKEDQKLPIAASSYVFSTNKVRDYKQF